MASFMVLVPGADGQVEVLAELTAMDMRQMEHSEEFTEAVSESRVDEAASFFAFCRASSCLCVFLL